MFSMDNRPLAERMRPTKLGDVVGQSHLLAKGEILREIIRTKHATSLILWGPPGSGKTTLARIIANEIDADFIEISAVTAGLSDVREVIKRASENQRLTTKTILFVDEIHRFNKKQQDAFLPHVESGLIILIGATTENPSYEVITPLLSRSRVLVLEPLQKNEIVKILRAAVSQIKPNLMIDAKALGYIAELSSGDARVALGNLELIIGLKKNSIQIEDIESVVQKKVPSYDKSGDMHYNIISAFIKSMRGSDVNATLYYLARMLQAGEDPKFIARRMVIFASEDVGIAASPALNLTISTFQAVERIGMPECQYNLFHCAIVLAKCEKSRVVADAMTKAKQTAEKFPELQVPLHVRNAPTPLMKDLGYGKDTRWEAGFKHPKGFLPPEIEDIDFF